MESYFANEFQDEAKDIQTLSLSDRHESPSDTATGSRGVRQENIYWSSSSPSSSSSISSVDHQDLFEFFTGDHQYYWSTTSKTPTNNLSTCHVPPDSILFCGKLFPSKQPVSIINNHKLSHSRTTISPTSNVGLFRRNYSVPSYYLQRSKSSAASTSNDSTIPRSKSVPVPRNGSLARRSGGKKDDNSVLKWTTKSRWFVFMFGMSSPSVSATTNMELSNLRSRLIINHQKSPSMLFRTSSSSEVDHDHHEPVGGNIGKSCFSFRCFGGL